MIMILNNEDERFANEMRKLLWEFATNNKLVLTINSKQNYNLTNLNDKYARKKFIELSDYEVLNFENSITSPNWKVSQKHIELFKYLFNNLPHDMREQFYTNHRVIAPFESCFNALYLINKPAALDFVKSKKGFSVLSSLDRAKDVTAKEIEDLLFKIKNICPSDELKDTLLTYCKKFSYRYEQGYQSGALRASLHEFVKNNLELNDAKEFHIYTKLVINAPVQDYIFQKEEEEVFIIRMSEKIFQEQAVLENVPGYMHLEVKDKIFKNVIKYINEDLKEYGINFFEKVMLNDKSKGFSYILSKKVGSYNNKEGVEKFIKLALDFQLKNTELAGSYEDLKVAFKSLYLYGDLKNKLEAELPNITEKKKTNKL